jgi:hypothetical protein
MHGSMATRGPAGAIVNEQCVINIADEKLRAYVPSVFYLGVAPETKIHVPLHEHLRIDGAVRAVANGAAFAQRRVLEDVRPGFFTMTLGAAFIETRHGQSACRFHDVHPVRVVALDAIHLAFEDRMMLRQMKLGTYFLMALKARFGVFAGIDDELLWTAATDHGDVFAARAVAGFAAALAWHVGSFQAQAGMWASGEDSGNIRMAIKAGFVADVGGSFNLQGDDHRAVSGAGVKQ